MKDLAKNNMDLTKEMYLCVEERYLKRSLMSRQTVYVDTQDETEKEQNSIKFIR